MRELIVKSNTNTDVIKSLVKKYGVMVTEYYDTYNKMIFLGEKKSFKDTFYEVMKYLADKEIYVTALEIEVQIGKNPKTADYVPFTNYEHTKYNAPTEYFERV